MSNKRLEALKALFKKEKDAKESGGKRKRGDMYPFWDMKVNEKATVRILPDKNEENPYMFYVDKLEHTISINGKDERVPCLHMYGEKCPICDLSRDFYKREGKESKNGKYYYRKKTSLVRLLVIEDPLPPDEDTGETCAGKVMNTQFGFQLMEKIKEELQNDEMGDDLPWDMKDGYNFYIKKSPQGEYGTYALGSGFAKRSTSIDPDIIDSIELIDLETLLPKNPGHEFVQRKLNAHINGSDDGDEGDDDEGDDDEKPVTKPATKSTTTTKPTSKPVAVVEDEDDDDGDDEDEEGDILEQIRRNRSKK